MPESDGDVASQKRHYDGAARERWPVSYTHLDVYKRQMVPSAKSTTGSKTIAVLLFLMAFTFNASLPLCFCSVVSVFIGIIPSAFLRLIFWAKVMVQKKNKDKARKSLVCVIIFIV